MASTNKTTNYELSQFQSADIPGWLTDYNGDMQKIDAGIHAAKEQAAGAAGGVSALQTAMSGKQDKLTFDSAPLADSPNPVTSGGIYNALQNVSVETDPVPTAGSSNAVQSGGVYTALQGKQNSLTFDSTPRQGSGNPVTSDGIYQALQNAGSTPVDNVTASGTSPVKSSGIWNFNDVLSSAKSGVISTTPFSNGRITFARIGMYRALLWFHLLPGSLVSSEWAELDCGARGSVAGKINGITMLGSTVMPPLINFSDITTGATPTFNTEIGIEVGSRIDSSNDHIILRLKASSGSGYWTTLNPVVLSLGIATT